MTEYLLACGHAVSDDERGAVVTDVNLAWCDEHGERRIIGMRKLGASIRGIAVRS